MSYIRNERTGWRDLALSERHGKWGYNCPAVDIDFLLVEYDNQQPVALVEYKGRKMKDGYFSDNSNVIAIFNLANLAALPAFVVEYYKVSGSTKWSITAINKMAMKKMDFFGAKISTPVSVVCEEAKYVSFLYWLRGRPFPEDIRDYIINNPF